MIYKIGIVGLGVMGHNLALNMERNGFPVAGYDLEAAKINDFLKGPAAGKNITGVESPAALMATLEKPRRILLMVPAGAAVDNAIANLKLHLEPGDILMDGGNSFFLDTERRNQDLEAEGFNFIGVGISGGEEGALWGPSLMLGGQREAWEAVAPSSAPSPPKPRTASPVWSTWGRAARVTMSRWCITASNTAICNSLLKSTTCSTVDWASPRRNCMKSLQTGILAN
jgi:6-phosphogluconate dehydrogenase